MRLIILLLIVTPFAAYGQTTSDNAEQKAALAMIARLGGAAEADETLPGKPIVKVDLHATAVSDADLAALSPLTALRQLDLRLTKITDEGVARLRELRQLRFLNLFRTNLSNKGLQQLGSLKELETLLIGGTKVTDEGLAHIVSFTKLRKLSVFDTQVTDAALGRLSKLPRLEVVLLGKSRVTEEGMKALQAALPKVRFTENTPQEPDQSDQQPPCYHKELDDWAFLEGDWTVRVNARLAANGPWEETEAGAQIKRELSGCLLAERFTGTRRGKPFHAHSLFAWNDNSKKLQQVFSDSEHGPLVFYEGAKAGQEILLDVDWKWPDGRSVRLRRAYFNLKPDSFTVESRRSPDGGKSWDTTGRLDYRRKAKPGVVTNEAPGPGL